MSPNGNYRSSCAAVIYHRNEPDEEDICFFFYFYWIFCPFHVGFVHHDGADTGPEYIYIYYLGFRDDSRALDDVVFFSFFYLVTTMKLLDRLDSSCFLFSLWPISFFLVVGFFFLFILCFPFIRVLPDSSRQSSE